MVVIQEHFSKYFYCCYCSCPGKISCDKIANNKEAYQYLAESIETFYNPNDFCDILESVKFKIVKLKKYLSGTACLYIATRI